MTGNPDKLETWGEIEAHLRKDRKTVLARGYPIHYHRVGKKRMVHAFKSELDAHDRGTAIIPAFSHKFPYPPISQPG